MMAYSVSLKVKLYRSAAVGFIWYDKAWRDDRKITWEDLDETIYAAAAMLLIWPEVAAPLLVSPPALAVESIVLGGFVISVAIGASKGGVEGGIEGGYNYYEFITQPKKYKERSVPLIRKYITEPVIDYVVEELWQKQLADPIGTWYDQRKKDLWRVIP